MKYFLNFFHRKYHLNYHGIYKNAKILFIFDIFLLTIAFSLFVISSFYYFYKPTIADHVEINFSYSSQEIVSGQDLAIKIDYQNNSDLALSSTVLAIHFPLGFSLDKAKNPQISDKNTIELGDIPAGGNGNLTIIGQIVGNTTEKDHITAILTYKIGNTQKIDQKQAMGLIEYADSQIKSLLTIEKNTFPDKTIPFCIKITNTSEKNIDNIGLILPNLAKTSPAIGGVNSKTPFSLPPNQEITLYGNFEVPKTIGFIPFSYQLTRNQNNQDFIQQTENIQIKVLNPNIIVKLIPQTTYNYLESGETLNVDVAFENISGNNLANQILILQDTNNVLDLSATAKENNIKEDGKNLIIDSNVKKSFENNSQIKSDLFSLRLKLKDNAGAISSSLNIVPIFSAKLFDSEINFSVTNTEINIPITSLLQTEITPRYYTQSGDQVGRGNLPPQIGRPTSYWIYVGIKNGANPLDNFSFTAIPGTNAIATGKQSIAYGYEMNIENKNLSWQKDTVPASTTIGLYFEIEVTPTEKDLGKEMDLLKEIKIEATDKLTGKKYLLNFGPVTNKLFPEDKGSEVDNKVVK